MTDYVKFTENNDHEGETWHFWILADGNESALGHFTSAIDGLEWYEIDLTPVPESEVDVLIKHTDSGYMAYHNKLSGVLVLAPEDLKRIEGDEDDPLYKGGIAKFLKEQ